MDLDQAIATRRSIRLFRDQDVPPELLAEIIDTARWAPSALNGQPCRIVVVREQERRNALERVSRAVFYRLNAHLAAAPVVLVVCVDGRGRYCVEDASALTMCLLLAAHARGLGACWIGLFDEARVKDLLGIPPRQRVVCLLPLGWPAVTPVPPPRLEVDELLFLEEWGRRQPDAPRRPTLTRRGLPSILHKLLRRH